MDGLTVLVEAKKEYLAQLCSVLCPHMIQAFESMYTEAQKISKGKKVLVQFQVLLKEVPNWNNHIISQHVSAMSKSCSWFSDLLAAVFVSYVKILSSVRLNSETKKISVKLPSNDVFVHGCYTNVAKDLYNDPYVYYEVMSQRTRDEQLTRRFCVCIENTVKEMIPVQEILKAYMSYDGSLEINNQPDQDTADPEIEESLDEPEDLPEVQAPMDVQAPMEAPPVQTDPQAPLAEPEIKEVNVKHDDELFPDANE